MNYCTNSVNFFVSKVWDKKAHVFEINGLLRKTMGFLKTQLDFWTQLYFTSIEHSFNYNT